jgi:hypothetical protein
MAITARMERMMGVVIFILDVDVVYVIVGVIFWVFLGVYDGRM